MHRARRPFPDLSAITRDGVDFADRSQSAISPQTLEEMERGLDHSSDSGGSRSRSFGSFGLEGKG